MPDPLAGENVFKPSGRGIYLINRLMDEVHFSDEGREIRMRKRGGDTASPPGASGMMRAVADLEGLRTDDRGVDAPVRGPAYSPGFGTGLANRPGSIGWLCTTSLNFSTDTDSQSVTRTSNGVCTPSTGL